jgi:hypothetical protein
LEIWEESPVNESTWFGKMLTATELTEGYARAELHAELKIRLPDIDSPFPEKDTTHSQRFVVKPIHAPHQLDDETPGRLRLEFTPVNFGTLPAVLIRKFLDPAQVGQIRSYILIDLTLTNFFLQLLVLKGDPLLRGLGPKFDDVDLSKLVAGELLPTKGDPFFCLNELTQAYL